MASPTLPPNTRLALPVIQLLPPDVLDNILLRLPLREIIRTSILSRPWRHRWCSIPNLSLRFRHQELPFTAMDRILLSHTSTVRSFLIETPNPYDADRWLITVFRRGPANLRFLSLRLGGPSHIPSLPSSVIFSFRQLHTLQLGYCSVPFPLELDSSGFPCLVELDLVRVHFCDDYQLPTLLSRCPALERLNLWTVRPDGRLEVRNPKLRVLVVSNCDFHFLIIDGSQTLEMVRIGYQQPIMHLDDVFRNASFVGRLEMIQNAVMV